MMNEDHFGNLQKWTNVIERLDIKSVEEEKIQKGKLQKDICLQYIIDNNRK